MLDWESEPYSVSIYENEAEGKVSFCNLPEHLLRGLAHGFGNRLIQQMVFTTDDEKAFCERLPERDAAEPRYMALLKSGVFEKRVKALREAGHTGQQVPYFMTAINRSDEAVVGRTGCIYFVCPKGCHFCQYRGYAEYPIDAPAIAERMLAMQRLGADNVHWVSPTAHTRTLVEALFIAAKEGLKIPVVHKSEGEDSLGDLKLLDGLVDMYLPDCKFINPAFAPLIGLSARYPERWRRCVSEMVRQVGPLHRQTGGLLQAGGVMVRHLLMPTGARECIDVLAAVRAIDPAIPVHIMTTYQPVDRAVGHPVIGRHVHDEEIAAITKAAAAAGLSFVLLR